MDSQKPMTPLEIKHAIENAGCTQVKIALMCGVSKPMVNQVIHGTAVSQRIRETIAAIIKRPVSEIWPVETVTT